VRWEFSKIWLKDARKVHWVWSHETIGNQSKDIRAVVTGSDRKYFGSYRVSME